MNNGYIEIMMPEHPNARANGTILEHRVMAEKKIGRLLKKTEVVHHLDGNKTNNTLDNLIVFKTNGDHSRFHKIGIKELDGDVWVCPIPSNKIVQCPCCGNYFVKSGAKRKNKCCSASCGNKMKLIKNNRTDSIPSKEVLEKLIREKPFTEIGKEYGVSDNAVRKWCKKYDIPYHYRDIHPIDKSKIKENRFLLDNYYIHIVNEKYDKVDCIKNIIIFIKEKYKTNTSERNIRTSITDCIKHNKKYFGFEISLVSEIINDENVC